MKLYRTGEGNFIEHEGGSYRVPEHNWDALIGHDDLYGYLVAVAAGPNRVADFAGAQLLAPIGNQEVWAAGVTYYRSRDARMAESKDAGGGDFYDRVYSAERPELFFKATASRVAAPGAAVRIRSDAQWSVPEPELTLVIDPRAQIIGYTIGNDMSSRDIEGENPLYLPQAKVYDRSSALGPCILVSRDPPPASTAIRLEIERAGKREFAGATTLAQLKRRPELLVEYLFRDNVFRAGAYLMTGTGIVPPDSFTLAAGDRVRISIDSIGTLENTVVQGGL
ncbi:MAG TPA: fumarylacetoacetate hydrolase family protein [Steroidobacteraceae bacterium]|nr:fumarylacetoacetate hydrolase family protein [Steroidobacteraceae bacterium]